MKQDFDTCAQANVKPADINQVHRQWESSWPQLNSRPGCKLPATGFSFNSAFVLETLKHRSKHCILNNCSGLGSGHISLSRSSDRDVSWQLTCFPCLIFQQTEFKSYFNWSGCNTVPLCFFFPIQIHSWEWQSNFCFVPFFNYPKWISLVVNYSTNALWCWVSAQGRWVGWRHMDHPPKHSAIYYSKHIFTFDAETTPRTVFLGC